MKTPNNTKKGPGRVATHEHRPSGTKLARKAQNAELTKKG